MQVEADLVPITVVLRSGRAIDRTVPAGATLESITHNICRDLGLKWPKVSSADEMHLLRLLADDVQFSWGANPARAHFGPMRQACCPQT